MAKILMSKSGQDDIRVDSTMVAEHLALGWAVVSGAMAIVGVDESVVGNPEVSAGILETLLLRHYQISPKAVSATGVHAAVNLAAAAQDVSTGITDPDYPRTVTAKGGVSGQTGNVVVSGTNILGEAISDTIALSGASEVEGSKAFKTVTNIHLPAQTHTSTAQVETATAVGTITGSGNASVIVTAAGMTGSPKTISVAVLIGDLAAAWAAKVRAALAADSAVAALFTVSGAGASIVLTRKTAAANDTSLNIALDNDTCTGITPAASSANTTAGVAYDTVSVGIAKKFGLPHIVAFATLLLAKYFNGSADTGTLAVDADEIEKNLFAVNGTPDGSALDLYYLA